MFVLCKLSSLCACPPNGFYLWYLDASYQVRKMWDSHQFDVSFLFAEKMLHFCQDLVFVAKIYDASLATLTQISAAFDRDLGGNPVSEKVFEVKPGWHGFRGDLLVDMFLLARHACTVMRNAPKCLETEFAEGFKHCFSRAAKLLYYNASLYTYVIYFHTHTNKILPCTTVDTIGGWVGRCIW